MSQNYGLEIMLCKSKQSWLNLPHLLLPTDHKYASQTLADNEAQNSY